MKRMIAAFIAMLCLSILCACHNDEGHHSQSSSVHNYTKEKGLLFGAEQWEIDKDKVYDVFDFYGCEYAGEDSEPDLPEFAVIEPIIISGKHDLPPITNATPLSEMIAAINGAAVLDAVENGIIMVACRDSDWSLPIHQLWGENRTKSLIPITFLRQGLDGSYYTVCKVEGGGYAYFFFNQPSEKEGEWVTVTDDPTDLLLSGAVYGEELHAYSEFSKISVGVAIDDVIAVDHSFQFFKDLYPKKISAVIDYHESLGYPISYINGGAYFASVLLSDGILEIIFEYNDPDYEQSWYKDETGKEHYAYNYDHLYVSQINYYPDYITYPKDIGKQGFPRLGIAYNRYILPIDRMTR